MKAHFLIPRDPIFIIVFLATFKFACDASRTNERAAMWRLSFFVENSLVLILNIHMSAAVNIAPAVAFVHSTKHLRQKMLHPSLPEVVNYLLKNIANYKAIAEMYSAILCYSQLASLTTMQYTNNLCIKICIVADVYNVSMWNRTFIKAVDSYIYHSSQDYPGRRRISSELSSRRSRYQQSKKSMRSPHTVN